MAIKIEIYCAMCGKETDFEAPASVTFKSKLAEILKPAVKRGWVLQQNGQHADIYCSARCAS